MARCMLQCGHGPKAVENACDAMCRTAADGASMRPRPEGRGEPTRRRRATANGVEASMRPRPEGRGEPDECACSIERWRYGFNAATARRPWRTAEPERVLTSTDQASMRPRPEGRGEPVAPAGRRTSEAMLQCGHGPKAVENSACSMSADVGPCASMRPRPEGRGERIRHARQPSGIGFNAATARRPWRTASIHGLCGIHASMRPRPEGRGELASRPASASATGFNAATTRRPWRTQVCCFVPQKPANRFNAATVSRPWRTFCRSP